VNYEFKISIPIVFLVVKNIMVFIDYLYFLLSYKSTYSRDVTRFSIPGGQAAMRWAYSAPLVGMG
jgi:hypothetical protein